MDNKVKTIRCDNGTEFKNRIMNEFYEMKGIRREFSVARAPQQNSVAERKNRTKPGLSFMRLFGCRVTILNTLDHLSTKANINAGQAGKKTVTGPKYVLLPLLNSDSLGPKSLEDKVTDDAGKKSTEVLRKENGVQDPTKEDPGRERAQRNEFESMFGKDKDVNGNSTYKMFTPVSPKSLEDKVTDDAGKKSTEVPRKENEVQDPTKEDPGRERAQRNEFESMFGKDKDANGNSTYKMFTPVSAARSSYVNLGGSIPINVSTLFNDNLPTNPLMPNLEDTVDLQDTRIFSGAYDDEVEGAVADYNNLELTIVIEAIRLFLAFTSFMGFIVYQMDVKSAFLYETIEDEVYVCQPPGFEDLHFPNKVYKIEMALYVLHQAPRAWELIFFLGLQVMQKDDGIFISQDKYVANILKNFYFSSVKTTSTPIQTNKALLKDKEAEDMDVYLYRSMIGSLMYLTASRPDIMFDVCSCARFQVTPKVSHLHAMKRIFRYLKGQPKLGLWYPRDSPFDLEAFSDNDYA
nr:putative reverse transcriptase, RNA-dependent DNA polymerase [Tanacetum cinerariifolium]